MKYIYNPLGSTFKEGEVTLIVKETKNPSTCIGCWYAAYKYPNKYIRNYTSSCYVHRHACTSHIRKDKKQVIFALVKE